jgi:two-component system sensor histidine kinase KdpD
LTAVPASPPAKLAEAFQPFQRLGDTDNTTGVGLALSNGFMEAMGGSLEAEDTPGGGLTMVVTLPTNKPVVAELPESASGTGS